MFLVFDAVLLLNKVEPLPLQFAEGEDQLALFCAKWHYLDVVSKIVGFAWGVGIEGSAKSLPSCFSIGGKLCFGHVGQCVLHC